MSHIEQAVLRLDSWLESLHTQQGYSGPITHWWESSLLYTGAMCDWRYEGVLCGYVTLYQRTSDTRWLERALHAAEPLCHAQLPDGTFRNSAFQQGPMEGGTPHEAAVDVGLLELASVLRANHDPRWEAYFALAARNLERYHLKRLWNGRAFADQPQSHTAIANKNATTLEALLLYQALGGKEVESYLHGAANWILHAQDTLGATVHLGTGAHRLRIGIYTARCASALLRLHEHTPDPQYLSAAVAMGQFLLSLLDQHGSIFGLYADGRRIPCPTWISPSGDVLRALLLLRPHMDIPQTSLDMLVNALIEGQLPSGGIRTAYGLGHKGRTAPPTGLPDFRDVLPVAGWCDKAFRALALLIDPEKMSSGVTAQVAEVVCTWKGQRCRYREDTESMSLLRERDDHLLYQWSKRSSYPSIYRL